MSTEEPIPLIEDDRWYCREDDQFLLSTAIQRLAVSNPITAFHDGQEALDFLETTLTALRKPRHSIK